MESKKLLKQANNFYSNFHKDVLKDYKEQLIDTLKKLSKVEECTRKNFVDAVNLAKEAYSVVEQLEEYYQGSRVPTVQKAITEVKEVLCLYQDVYELQNNLDQLSLSVSVEDQLKKASESSTKRDFKEKVKTFQDHLSENGIGILKASVTETAKPIRNVKEEQVKEYKVILKQNIEMIRNIKNQTIGELLNIIDSTLDIESHREELEYIYQNSSNLAIRIDVLDIYDQLENCLLAQPLVSYFDKVSPEMNIGSYLESRSEQERAIIEEEISSISSAMDEKEEDFLEVIDEKQKIVDETKEKYKKLALEVLNQKFASLERETLEETLERLEASGIIKDVSEEPILENEAIEEKTEIIDQEKSKELTLEGLYQGLASLENETLEDTLERLEDIGVVQEAPEEPAMETSSESVVSLENETIEETLERLEANGLITETTEKIVPYEELEVVEKPRKIKLVDKAISKMRELRETVQEKGHYHVVRREYLKEIKKLQVQLDNELKSELTFKFLDRYKNNYYQNRLKEIRKMIEEKYGKEITKVLRKDPSIVMARKEITRVMKQLKEGFTELLGETITRIDGTTVRFVDLENVSEDEFHLMIQTIPVLIGEIEENMRLVQSGRSAKKLELKILDLNLEEKMEIIEMDEKTELNETPSYTTLTEVAVDVEEVEDPIMTRALVRGAKAHYRNCKKLLAMKDQLAHRDDLEQFSKQLKKSLEGKRKLITDSSKLWYVYKCSVEELSNSVRGLSHTSSVEVNQMIEKICGQCQKFVTYFEAYQECNKRSVVERIQEAWISTIEDFKETFYEPEMVEENEFSIDEQGIDQIIYDSLKKKDPEEVFDVDFSLFDENEESKQEELQLIPVKPSVRNLEVTEAALESQEIKMQEDTRVREQTHVVFGVTQANAYMPLFDLGALEAQIRYLASQNMENENQSQEIYQKAI